ncbi:uncharacterized protein LOC117315969 [Pecten maximus]|uniref:uncharacterized protein LOC117315969 n=1 Tax=Pecten maximus TaxID=6579 RepID=UPI001458A48C|nr:uncharacterized protein LOC117315969 [Pecten maximus]
MERLNVSSINSLHFVDNTNKEDPAFQEIRDEIVTLAPSQENWNKRIPATWVTLDIDLRMLKQQKRYIIRFSEVMDIDRRNEVSIGNSEEIKNCLRYMHLTGNILFFENVQDAKNQQEPFVVTHPQWIVDAFRCIIRAMRFIKSKNEKTKLQIVQIQRSGILTLELLESLLGSYRKHQDILIEIMQRLHLLVAITQETADRKWIVPSLLPPRDALLFNEVLRHPSAVTSKTLCFVFKSKLLPAIHDKLLATCLSSPKIKIKKDSEGKSLMQRGSACFMLTRACDLLVSCKGAVVSCTLINKNGETDFKGKYGLVRSFFVDRLKQVFTRFHHGNIVYELCLHCKHDICSDTCPVPILDINTDGPVRCCEYFSDDLHFLDKSDAESWMEEKESKVKSGEDIILTNAFLNSRLTDRMLSLLSRSSIGTKYELFFAYLGLQSGTIDSHKNPNTDITNVIFNLFVTWKNWKGEGATIREILEGMKKYDLDYTVAAHELGQEYNSKE